MTSITALSFSSPAGTLGWTRWLLTSGLLIVLWVVGSILAIRVVRWSVDRITGHIDQDFAASDDLVRTEAAKHRHALAQVAAWVAIAIICTIAAFNIIHQMGVPISGFVAPATVLGAALGFGAQRVVQDLLAGFFIITEKQYGFGDVVQLTVTGGTEAEGTLEDVTLRVTKLRSSDGEVITIPNGQIVKATNLSKDWARAVVDIPFPSGVDVGRVTDLLHDVGEQAFDDEKLKRLLLDAPTTMGVIDVEVDQVTVRLVARTLPGKQFEVSRALRTRIIRALGRAGIALAPGSAITTTSVSPDVSSSPSLRGEDASEAGR
ncbi:mechanosensitive ion channel family protein [Jongsikchunia kroppenstedtii]|uniref:mechanosensitive ion channel family protein n=1 Tax=Jongsikchunia kroppenstedtii TaxID=1121721 RepID=UPI00036CC5D9|nr:mechanosensitive ion channel family protein [Jongsikchunia kroppenstedtii]